MAASPRVLVIYLYFLIKGKKNYPYDGNELYIFLEQL